MGKGGRRENSGRVKKTQAEGKSVRGAKLLQKVASVPENQWTYQLAECMFLPLSARIDDRRDLPPLLLASFMVGRIVKQAVYPEDIMPQFRAAGPDDHAKVERIIRILHTANKTKLTQTSKAERAKRFTLPPELKYASLAASCVCQQIHPIYNEQDAWLQTLSKWYCDMVMMERARTLPLMVTMFVIARLRDEAVANWFMGDASRMLRDKESITNFIVECTAAGGRKGTTETGLLSTIPSVRNAMVSAPCWSMLNLACGGTTLVGWVDALLSAANHMDAIKVCTLVPGVKDYCSKNILMVVGYCEERLCARKILTPLPWFEDWSLGERTVVGPNPEKKTIEKKKQQGIHSRNGARCIRACAAALVFGRICLPAWRGCRENSGWRCACQH